MDSSSTNNSFYLKNLADLLGAGTKTKPFNVSGIYSGHWGHMEKQTYLNRVNQTRMASPVLPMLTGSIHRGNSHNNVLEHTAKGSMWLFLHGNPPPDEKMLKNELEYVTGTVILHNDDDAPMGLQPSVIMTVQGVFLRHTGQLTLYGNQPNGLVQVEYNSSMATKPSPMAYSLNPTRSRQRQGRFRPASPNLGEMCVYEMDLQMKKSNEEKEKMDGMLASSNCDLYLNVSSTFEEANLHTFYSRASYYATFMTFVCFAQIYLLVRQIQSSNTQASAAKVSLVTIGQQAIIDSYLCLIHLTAGIIIQSIFAAFATVAFLKLIIFSIFEMRYLLLIWKARRPQSFTEGWATMRRELTVLYSRFYGTLLFGIILLYNGWYHANFMMLIVFSFWIPQIVHNAHREAKNSLDRTYLFGMSALRLVLPLYFYGCSSNFLIAFPMYQYESNLSMCFGIISWVGIQVLVLILQDHLGPRFFIPARFLPVKYTYTRRIDEEQLELLQSHETDTVDCVICMGEVDIEGKSYMIAPCDHIFHQTCLEEWMEIKMECPTCRSVLPVP